MTDLLEVLHNYNVEVKRGKALCPFHGEKTPSFSVSNNLYHCFGCGAAGDAITFVMNFEHVNYIEALKILDIGDYTQQNIVTAKWDVQESAYARTLMNEHISDMHYAEMDIIYDYLASRGITGIKLNNDFSLIERCYHNKTDRHGPTMLALIRDRMNEVVSAHRTYIDNNKVFDRLLMPSVYPGVTNGAAVRAIVSDSKRLIIAEGLETLLSIYMLNGGQDANYWSTISANGMAQLSIPGHFETIEIYADFDRSKTGQKAAKLLADRYDCQVFYPTKKLKEGVKSYDFNDLLIDRC